MAANKPKYIYQLPYLALRDLGRILDDNNQWKELGGAHFQYDITTLNEFGRRSSPTEAMFSDWGQKNHTILELFQSLSRMQHYRCMKILLPLVDERYHALYHKGEVNPERMSGSINSGVIMGATAVATPQSVSTKEKTLPFIFSNEKDGASGGKPALDSCNFNSPGNERSFGSKLVTFPLGPSNPSSNPIAIAIDPSALTKSDNAQASWNTPPALLPSPSPHGPNNNGLMPTRRDSESSAFSDASSASAMSSIPPIDEMELAAATNQWDSTSILGKGGFGTVYKGTWKNTQVAVKRMENKGLAAAANLIPMQQSMGELRILNAVRHDNILPLYGYSLGGDFPCLVYQFMPNGSLEDRLLCRQSTFPLKWEQRLNIARGAARGLQFLHTMSDKPLIHGDIKSANILLDKNYEAKIGDFGLAREGPQQKYTHMKVSKVHGTKPYLPDEYLRGRKISTKVDTYSFGIVLFELGTGLRVYDNTRENHYLRDHVENSNWELLFDPKAGQDCNALYKPLMQIGLICAATNAKDRPEMVKVLKDLDYLAVQMEQYLTSLQSAGSPFRQIPSPREVPPAFQQQPNFPLLSPSPVVATPPIKIEAIAEIRPTTLKPVTAETVQPAPSYVQYPKPSGNNLPHVDLLMSSQSANNLPNMDLLMSSKSGILSSMASAEMPKIESLLEAVNLNPPDRNTSTSSSSSSDTSYVDSSRSSDKSDDSDPDFNPHSPALRQISKTNQKQIPFLPRS